MEGNLDVCPGRSGGDRPAWLRSGLIQRLDADPLRRDGLRKKVLARGVLSWRAGVLQAPQRDLEERLGVTIPSSLGRVRRRVAFVFAALVGVLLAVAVVRAARDGSRVERPSPYIPPNERETVTGQTYYVSARGSDSSSGTSPRTAWRTVRRVNAARELRPGDRVLFQGGAVFAGEPLDPEASGRRGAPVVFGSFGGWPARIADGVRIKDARWLTFRGLAVSRVPQGFVGSSEGAGSSHLVLEGNVITDVSIAVNAANARDYDWVVRRNRIRRTGDSGIILVGRGHEVLRNSILHTGKSTSITYPKHGIYLKSAGSRVIGNTIRDFSAEGVSSRRANASIERNVISGGQVGIAWYQTTRARGQSVWRDNAISRTTQAGLFVSGSDAAGRTRESFVISGNRLTKLRGVLTNLAATAGTYAGDDTRGHG